MKEELLLLVVRGTPFQETEIGSTIILMVVEAQGIYIYTYISHQTGRSEDHLCETCRKRKVILLGTLGGQTLHVDIERLVEKKPC